MRRGDGSSTTPALLTVLTLLGLFGLVIFFYLFYKAELKEAIYTSVLTETRNRLQNTVSSYINMINKERELHEKIKELGVHYGQGYYYGKPSPEIKSQRED